jgi:hypothetical protein
MEQDTIACPYCKETIKLNALICKHCHSDLRLPSAQVSPVAHPPVSNPDENGTLWIPVPSLILGVLSFVSFFDDSSWDMDTAVGIMLFSAIALILGIVGVSVQKVGRGMSITGIVLGALSFILAIGIAAEIS